jgi:hypothetical protein
VTNAFPLIIQIYTSFSLSALDNMSFAVAVYCYHLSFICYPVTMNITLLPPVTNVLE